MKIKLLLLLFSFCISPLFSQNENANSNSQKTFRVKKLKPIKRNYQNNGNNNTLINASSAYQLNSSTGSEISETPGELSVSLTGGATYTVPIKVPPGINGVEPEIALTYNSQGGNGLAGYGWNISGLSVITRIPKTKYHDGEIGNVDLSQNDRFSFDGQRLVLKSGTYGASGSIYETENYSNLKIEAFSSYYNGPGYFKVTYPDGSFAYYGQTSNSRTRMDYAITYWQNPQGVRISYEYTTSYNSLSISKIKYGSRLTNTPINEIQFEYKTRKRKEQSYVGGIRFVRNTILSKIKVLGNGVGFRNYELSHLENSLGYERLQMVQEESGNNLESFDPITFNYQATFSQTLVAEATGDIGLNNVEQRNAIATTFDAGGEGVMDFTIHAKTLSERDKFWLFENVRDENGSFIFPYQVTVGTFQELFPVSYLSHANKILPGQGLAVVQNNGSSDVDFRIVAKAPSGVYQQYEKTWSAPTYTNQYTCGTSGYTSRVPLEYISGDFDGDGLTDVIAISKSYSTTTCFETLPQPGDPCGPEPLEPYIAKSTNDKSSTSRPSNKDDKELTTQRIEPIEDGCCQCNTYSYNSSKAYFINLRRDVTSNFANYAGYLSSTLSSSDQLITADVNGDGKTDILQVKDGTVYVYSLNSNESLSLLFSYSSSYIDKDFPILLGDYNGDGKTDFMYPTSDNSTYFATFLSTGTTFYRYNQYQPFTYKKTYYDGYDGTGTMYSYNLIPTDINGDGRTDIIDYRTTTYNYSSSGTQTIKTYNNTYPSTSYGNPKFVYQDTKSQTGYLKHYPIPIFLNSEQNNFNLEFCSISHESITAFEFQKDNREEMLLRSVGQNGVYHSISYSDLSEDSGDPYYGSIYTSTYDEIYPYVDIHYAPGLKLVKSLTRTGSGLTTIKKEFLYHGAVSHIEGLGFTGFKGFASTNWHIDQNDRIFNVAKYSQDLRGLPTEEYNTTEYVNFNYAPSTYISKTNYSYSTPEVLANKVFKVYKTGSVTQNELNGSSINMSYTYDTFLNPKIIITNFSTGESKRLENFYNNSTGSNYYIGRLSKKIKTSTIDNNSFVSEESYSYNSLGLVTSKNVKGNGGTASNSYNYTYDVYGNVLTSKFTPSGESSLTSSYVYDSSGRFVIKKIDNEGLESQYEINSSNGKVIKEIDPFGFEGFYSYDDWNRPVSYTNQLGTTTTVYEKSNNELKVTSTSPDGATLITLYNKLYQVKEKHSKDALGQWIKRKIEYDPIGRVARESEPFIFAPSQWNSTEYDLYGRIIKKTSYTGKVININYSGLSATIDDGTKSETVVKDAMGNIIEKSTSGTGTIHYTYFGNGKLKKADFDGSAQIIEQDEWGRRTKLVDPSAGIFQYQYDGFGNIIKEINPNGEITYSYDSAGRLLTKVYSGSNTASISYNYNSNSKLLTSISSTGDINSSYTYTYDSSRRLTSELEINGDIQFLTEYSYNNLGQIITEEYTANKAGKTSSKKIKNSYQNGSLRSIRDYNTNNLIWQLEALNHRGQVLNESFGESIEKISSYDTQGFLTSINSKKEESGTSVSFMTLNFDFDNERGILNSRTNSLFNWSENFTYDSLNRLINYNDNSGNNSHDYDSKGRIVLNSKIGNYNYSGNSFRQSSLNLNTAGQSYYNNLNYQTVEYNSFRKPLKINEFGNDRVDFEYNAFESRTTMYYGGTQSDKNLRKYIKHYSSNGKMEVKVDKETSTTTFITYLGGDAYSAPAIYHSEKGSSNTSNLYYLHRDYLGSILAITDENGEFKEKRHFDAWGEVVKIEDGNGNSIQNFKIMDRGYTGHEHLLGVGLIHMNGRLYDPLLHRFLSPDNYVQDPSNPLNFNRYSYVLNNPLMYTDVTGDFFWFAVAIGAAIGAITQALQPDATFGSILGGAIIGGLAGMVGAGVGNLVAGGTFFGSSVATTIGFGSGFASGFAGGFAGGFVGGTGTAWLNGASFGDGLISGLKAGAIGGAMGGLINGISSGVRASKHGLDFWSGEGTLSSDINPTISGGNSEVEFSNEATEDFIGTNPELEKLRSNVDHLYADGTAPTDRGYFSKNGNIYSKKDGLVGGVTVLRKGGILGLGSKDISVYMSKVAYHSRTQLYLTLHHEFMHATFMNIAPNLTNHHSIINQWERAQMKAWGWNGIPYNYQHLIQPGYLPQMFSTQPSSKFHYFIFGFRTIKYLP